MSPPIRTIDRIPLLAGAIATTAFARTASAQADPSAGDTAPPLPDITASFVRMLVVVGVLCLILVAALWWLRRRGLVRPDRTRSMRIVESLRIGAGREILLVEIGGRYQLLGATPDHITMLCGDPLDAAEIDRRLADSPVPRSAPSRQEAPAPAPFPSVFHGVSAEHGSGAERSKPA